MKVVKTGEEIRKEALEKKHTEVGQSPVTFTQNPYESVKKKSSVKTLIVVKWKKKS